ncbi:ALI_HP2_G0042960.mRNA.1.CDS.1 [Saccharomyces cerevisiae]|nr:ALI_HP2_G0042960.mRNA.1.CDS.1 [Saccharomyces cerevisiae]CAI6642674.1 ALI_HP2_G0042960.mRNA.1.CDS.1 [Saccharomyces cerevisiae]CAI6700559.1 ALI_collapsed_G0018200.mRNA.1.CDS.1 [Saccharomyces cerevisiae]
MSTKESVEVKPKNHVLQGDQQKDVPLLGHEEENEIPKIVLPADFKKCSRTDLVILISRMLSFLIHINDSMPKGETKELTRFHSRVPPDISVFNYLMRLTKYSSLEPAVLISSVYYIDLLSSVYSAFTLNSLTVHRFLLTATSVGSKGLCDSFCTNTHYAKVGGVQCSELHVLENEFLKRVNYRILPRDDNITNCKMEKQCGTFVTNTPPEVYKTVNNGFNVLDTYYRKIIEIVGSFHSSPDKTKKVHYTLSPPSSHEAPRETSKKRHFDETNNHSTVQSPSLKKPA